MKKTRYLTDAAMVVSIMLVLLIINSISGGFVISNFGFLLPVPLLLYGLKYDWKKAFLPAISLSIISFFINVFVALIQVMPICLLSVLYVFVLSNKKFKNMLKISIMFCGSLILNILTTVVFSKLLFGYDIIEDTKNLANSLIIGLSNLFPLGKEVQNAIHIIFISIIPATIIITSLIETIVVYLVTSIISQRLLKIGGEMQLISYNIAVPKIVTFTLLPLAIFSLFFLNLVINNSTTKFLQFLIIIGLNLFVLLTIFYIIEASILVELYFVNNTNRIIVLLFVFIAFFIFSGLMCILGILDSIFNFRYRLMMKKIINN